MKHFTDRLFYCDDTDTLAHVMYIAPERWALSMLRKRPATGAWEWITEIMTRTYEQAYSLIGRDHPVLLVQESEGGI